MTMIILIIILVSLWRFSYLVSKQSEDSLVSILSLLYGDIPAKTCMSPDQLPSRLIINKEANTLVTYMCITQHFYH